MLKLRQQVADQQNGCTSLEVACCRTCHAWLHILLLDLLSTYNNSRVAVWLSLSVLSRVRVMPLGTHHLGSVKFEVSSRDI